MQEIFYVSKLTNVELPGVLSVPYPAGRFASDGAMREPDLPIYERFSQYEDEPQLFTTRIPGELFYELKRRSLRSTLQTLTEHAYLLYIGNRLPPDLLGGYEWPEEYPVEPGPEYLKSKLRSFSVRLPRHVLRWARVFAVQAEISDQELAVRVFDWYVRTNRYPPNKEDVRRDERGYLAVSEPLLALEFEERSEKQLLRVVDILVDRHTKFGGPLASTHHAKTTISEAAEAARGPTKRDTTIPGSKKAT